MRGRPTSTDARGALVLLLFVCGGTCGSACGRVDRLDLGSDVLWSAQHEGGNVDEWLAPPGGRTLADPPLSNIVSAERAHRGSFAAKLTITATADNGQQNSGLTRSGGLPIQAYYSAWYYLPQSVTVGTFWVIFKLRARRVLDDPASAEELYDLELSNLPTGEMTLLLFDHRSGGVPLDVVGSIVPVGRWFQIEAFYRNTPDATGRVTYWLDGRQIVDLNKPGGPTPWVEWNAVNVAQNLMPATVTLFIDDAAISKSRVGPEGIVSE
jgi:hypothetical protein